jgi:hypothetical protein
MVDLGPTIDPETTIARVLADVPFRGRLRALRVRRQAS